MQVMELYGSYMRKQLSGTKILHLLANLCSPGDVVDLSVSQSIRRSMY
jgi:hypothetical protein